LKKIITLVFAVISISTAAQGTFTVSGTIRDTNKVPIEMVSVALLDVRDSSLVYFGLTNLKGQFVITGVKGGSYIFQSSFMGFSTISRLITVNEDGVFPSVDMIEMTMKTNILSEIIIRGERIPIVINKDTVSYDAGAFQVGADETAEDLLRRLPGIEVDPDGRVTAQGEEVKKVLVDGKEFFGGNVQLATRNLPADAIKKVKVYDRQSEDAMFTGVDDGQRDKTIDLELKDDRKKGVFGDIEGSMGTMQTDIDTETLYRAKGGIHAFTPKTRLSFLGNANNLNQLGFNYNDLMSMAGEQPGGRGGRGVYINSSGAPPMDWSGPNTGVFSSLSSGFNLNYDPSKKHRLNANYFLAYSDHLLTEKASAQEFNRDNIINTNEENRERNLKLRHQAYAEYRWEPDTNNRIEFTLNGSLEENNQRHSFASLRQTDELITIQEGNRTLNRLRNDMDVSGKVNYIHKFKKKGRNVQFTGIASSYREDSDENYFARFEFPEQVRTEVINQIRVDLFRNNAVNNTLIYNEPLAKKHRITVRANSVIRERQQIIDVNNVGNPMLIDSLSPDFMLSYMEHAASARYVYSVQENNDIGIEMKAANYRQGASDVRSGNEIPMRAWNYFLPGVSWYRQSKGFGRTYAGINRDVNLPQLNQLMVNADYRDPLFIILGNPGLNPEINNSLYLHHYVYNSFKQTNFSINVNASITETPIVNAQEISETFERIVRPVNAEELQYSTSGGTGYRFPVKKLKIFLRTGANVSYARVNIPINQERNLQENTTATGSLALNNFTKGKWEVTVRGVWSLNWANYSAQPQLNRYFTSQNYIGTLVYRPDKRFIIRTDMDYMIFSQESFADALAIPRWNASISYSIIKNGDLITRISAFDILGRNVGLQRFANANFIRQSETNLLTRYVMVSLIYKFRKQ
jgi:hypothetical protein